MTVRVAVAAGALLAPALLGALSGDRQAVAQSAGGDACLTADPPAIDRPPERLRFGITPLPAGRAGGAQVDPAPAYRELTERALERLVSGRRRLVLRLNRMFMADGVEGIRRYAAIVDRHAEAGFDSELQVRYHPSPSQEGDVRAWEEYVRSAARILGRRPSVLALSITNEANFPVSPNTSDGSYRGARSDRGRDPRRPRRARPDRPE